MTRQEIFSSSISTQLNPVVGRIAKGLMRKAGNDSMIIDDDSWSLIEEMLDYAAGAEQQLKEQRNRISHLESLSITDDLTGLTNRRGLIKHLKNILSGAKRHGEDGVLAFLDMDGFKSINDTFGHKIGDEVLCRIGRILNQNTRDSDFTCRLGGDEFVVVLDRCLWEQGVERLSNLKESINATPLIIQGFELNVGISIGIEKILPDSTLDQLLKAADTAMYINKKRNKLALKAMN
jgi:diguanylate cyclase (GGDEF)-like protein